MASQKAFDPGCKACPRLTAHLDQVRERHPHYFCAPVPPFGEARPACLIVGLAPGLHGANRTGRPFTGDHAGILLYETLYRLGMASAAVSKTSDDGLRLKDCRITNAVKCLPPENKPTGAEVALCNPFLSEEIAGLRTGGAVILALGGVAHRAVLKALGLPLKDHPFAHDRLHAVGDGLKLLDSYHCSRYNTQTGRLTREMFLGVMTRARTLMGN